MPPVIKVTDQNDLVPTINYPHAKFPFEFFNPVQSRAFDYYDKDFNAVIASKTSSGKTITAEIFMAHTIRAQKKKAMYLAPLRALAQEKYDDWTDKSHHFSDLNISICTGDYRLTKARIAELNNADIIVMSSEMLNHRARNQKSEQSQFLNQIGSLVIDECFPGKTLIRVESNIDISIKSIYEDESIKYVVAFDEKTNSCVNKKIVRRMRREKKTGFVTVTHENGSFTCTEDHKIWTENGYKKAIDLNSEDKLKWIPKLIELFINNHSSSVIKVKKWCGKTEYVYDLEVEDCHNYFADGVLVSNCHLLTVEGRGDHLESGMMKFTEINPDCRLILLSATMPNVSEIADWVSYILTQKNTFLLTSDYRPCPLNVHYEKYWDGDQYYEDQELQKALMAQQIIEYYPEDKFLVFAHTKRTGEKLKLSLKKLGIGCEFHNADLTKDKRIKLEKNFKEDPNLKVVIATSTLAWGCNLPARRVIIMGVHRGLSEVQSYDIFQMIGRAGRPAFDPIGDAYILLPEKMYDVHKARLKSPQPIISQMLNDLGGKHKVLAFHLVNEIYQGDITDKDDVYHWYKRSLASFQSHEFDDVIVDEVINLLKKCGAIWEEDDGKYTINAVGKISSMFYYSPFDVADLKRNFNNLFDNHQQDDDYALSIALGNTDTQRCGICSKLEKEEMGKYAFKVAELYPNGTLFDSAIKAGYAYYLLMNGQSNNHFSGVSRGLQFDFPRLSQVLQSLDGFTGKWNRKQWFNQLQMRVAYGVKGPMAVLCVLPGLGKVRATKLWNAGIKTIQDVIDNPAKVRTITGLKKEKIDEIMAEAKNLT